jgi:hypothetical protein
MTHWFVIFSTIGAALGFVVVACGPSPVAMDASESDSAGSSSGAEPPMEGGNENETGMSDEPMFGGVPNPSCPQTDGGMLAAYGTTGILHSTASCNAKDVECDNLQLTRNMFECLGSGRTRDGRIAILYASDCDPRFDEQHCYHEDWSEIAPFFDLIDEIGYIDFAFPSAPASLHDYSLVIADLCRAWAPLTPERETLAAYARDGGRLLVLGDNFCAPAGGKSASFANLILEEFGTSFTTEDPAADVPLVIPDDRQLGLLEGVGQLLVWRVTPQRADTAFATVFASELGPLLTITAL